MVKKKTKKKNKNVFIVYSNLVFLPRYDGHRDSILRGEDQSQKDSSAGTTAEDLMRYFSVSEFKGYEDTNKVSVDAST
jgi:hypothetical protein